MTVVFAALCSLVIFTFAVVRNSHLRQSFREKREEEIDQAAREQAEQHDSLKLSISTTDGRDIQGLFQSGLLKLHGEAADFDAVYSISTESSGRLKVCFRSNSISRPNLIVERKDIEGTVTLSLPGLSKTTSINLRGVSSLDRNWY